MMKKEIESSEDEDEKKEEKVVEHKILEDMETITFYKDISEYTKVHITQDCEKVVFCNGSENFKAFIAKKPTSQKNLP
jgi:nanoRNase/pAp phosphatase (c-di-AMP/oligoRNAs hydrolase)